MHQHLGEIEFDLFEICASLRLARYDEGEQK
jgi:hypothetical protein